MKICLSLWQFGEARTALGSGLLHYGLAPHATVGIYSVNCTGWVLTAEACNAYSMVTVPLYDTLGPDAVRYISGHAELAAIACSANLLSVLLEPTQVVEQPFQIETKLCL